MASLHCSACNCTSCRCFPSQPPFYSQPAPPHLRRVVDPPPRLFGEPVLPTGGAVQTRPPPVNSRSHCDLDKDEAKLRAWADPVAFLAAISVRDERWDIGRRSAIDIEDGKY